MVSEDGGDVFIEIGDCDAQNYVATPLGCPKLGLFLLVDCKGPKEGNKVCEQCPISQGRGTERSLG